MTSKEVSIKLFSRQSDGNTKEETELISAGLYEATEKGYRISYEESEALGYEVKALKRIAFAGLTLSKLKRGEYRKLTETELLRLRKKIGDK